MAQETGDFITRMTPWKYTRLERPLGTEYVRPVTDGAAMFRDVFLSAAGQVKETQLDVENKQYLLATGQLEDAHSLPIAENKASISLNLLISLRNKAIEGYNELMKLNV